MALVGPARQNMVNNTASVMEASPYLYKKKTAEVIATIKVMLAIARVINLMRFWKIEKPTVDTIPNIPENKKALFKRLGSENFER